MASVAPLCDHLVVQEEWLMQRVLDYAHERDYTKYTSTLVEAWRISIVGLTETIQKAAALGDAVPELGPDDDYVQDPIASFGIMEAQKHRERGITLSMFLGLLKYYRQSYIDCVAESEFTPEEMAYYCLFIDRCFDRVEIGFCQEWANVTGGEKLSELHGDVPDSLSWISTHPQHAERIEAIEAQQLEAAAHGRCASA